MPNRPARIRHHRRTAVGALALTAILLLATAACGDDKKEGPTADATTTTTSKVATSTTVKPEQLPSGHFIALTLPPGLTPEEKEMAEAYRSAVEAFARALRTPTTPAPDLTATHEGEALDAATERIHHMRQSGTAVRLPAGQRIAVEVIDASITPKAAGMLVCLTDGSESYHVSNGTTDAPADSPPHQVVVTLVHQAGTWKLSQSISRKGSDGKDRSCTIGG